ncbi:MAG: DUF2510 domain-containing protein [Acidobacteria bacterium]|nr:DUF2510 domain-containing protein [Acidobacteriota bacterium]
MTERSAQGWEILQIVATGSQVTAFVRRAAIAGSVTSTAATVAPTPASPAPTAVSTPSPTPVSQPAATVATSTASSVGDAVAPAAWYPDPSGRYELRYWNGSAWTEHVSRNGQQFTDPPVA